MQKPWKILESESEFQSDLKLKFKLIMILIQIVPLIETEDLYLFNPKSDFFFEWMNNNLLNTAQPNQGFH